MTTRPQEITLNRQAIFDLPDASEASIRCEEGCLWITLDNDPRDIVLEPGQSFATDQRRHALVYALEVSRLSVRARAEASVHAADKTLQPLAIGG